MKRKKPVSQLLSKAILIIDYVLLIIMLTSKMIDNPLSAVALAKAGIINDRG
jgi:hypothetical protein